MPSNRFGSIPSVSRASEQSRREDLHHHTQRTTTQSIYATGAGVQFSDRATVEAILARLTAKGGGLRTIVHEITESEVFQNK
jgi:hypothetical protein